MRIDRIFGTTGYTNAFGSAPLVFGAFPSLHAGTATMEALFLTHFFPRFRYVYWGYVGILYWSTMYLTHHYLIDVVGGGCLALASFFYFMPKEFKDIDTGINWEGERTYENDDYDLDQEIRDLEGPSVPLDSLDEEAQVEAAASEGGHGSNGPEKTREAGGNKGKGPTPSAEASTSKTSNADPEQQGRS